MSMNVWEGIIESPIQNRLPKPRSQGCTMVIDKGLSLQETVALIETAGDHIDLVKFTFGTSALYPADVLANKIQTIRQAGIGVFPGGTLLEIAVFQGKARQYIKRAAELGFDYMEISDGTVPINSTTRYRLFDLCRVEGFHVISEVGKKNPLAWEKISMEEIRADLAHGAEMVIIEARESGKGIGIYDENGKVKEHYLERISENVPVEKVMWESPLKAQQAELINRFGPNVNLGNIPTSDVIPLEALRLGLRADTLNNILPFNRRVPALS
jgi:phosphosulfolactate synthase